MTSNGEETVRGNWQGGIQGGVQNFFIGNQRICIGRQISRGSCQPGNGANPANAYGYREGARLNGLIGANGQGQLGSVGMPSSSAPAQRRMHDHEFYG